MAAENEDDVDFEAAGRADFMFPWNPRFLGGGRGWVEQTESVEERSAEVADDGNPGIIHHGVSNSNAHGAVVQRTMCP